MIILSTLRHSMCASVRWSAKQLARKPNNQVAVRYGSGGGQHMDLKPSMFQSRRFKDDLHFYIMLGALPLLGIVAYTNLFIGQATLSDTPEGYEPKEYEYYKHPIERWFMRNIYPSMRQQYETAASEAFIEGEKAKYRARRRKAEQLMSKRGDYKSWYYVPSNLNVYVAGRKHAERIHKDLGTDQ